MARRVEARIAFATVVPPALPGGIQARQAVNDALVPGRSVERYGREWRIGPLDRSAQFVSGRLGFQRVTGTVEIWDEQRQDFREQAALYGLTSPFAIRLRDLRVAFQRRPGMIERQSFAGALRALLDEGSAHDGWDVEPEAEPVAWQQFVERVERITKLMARVERPNPNYQGRSRLEALVEGAAVEYLTLTAVAREGESVNTAEPTIAEAIQHVAAQYGRLTAEGPREGVTMKYDSDRDGIAPEERLALPADQREASGQQLRRTLREGEERSH